MSNRRTLSKYSSLLLIIYDPAVWHKYGWSLACDPEYRKRSVKKWIREASPLELAHEQVERRALANLDGYLIAVLKRTRKYHDALNAVSNLKPPVGYYVFAGDCEETLQSFVIVRDEKRNRFETLTQPREIKGTDGRRFSKKEVQSVMFAPGDGRVTRRSLLAETFAEERPADSVYKTTLPLSHSFLICLVHGYIQDSANVHDEVLSFLVNDGLR